MPISDLPWLRDAQQGLREDLKILVMSATLDGARVAALLGDAPVVASEGRAYPGGDALSRPRSARAHREPGGGRRRSAPCAPIKGRCWCSCRAPAEIRRTETLLKERVADGNVDIVTLVRRARCARAGPRHFAGAGGAAQGGAGDLDRGNLAHHRRRARGDRQRSVARAALRARRRPDAAGNRAGFARRRRPAARARRAHRAGRLLPAVGRAADRLARSLYAAGNIVGRSVVLRARPRAMGRRRSGQAGVSRCPAGGGARRSQSPARRPRSDRRGRPHHRGRPALACLAVAAAASAHGGRCRGARRRRTGGGDRRGAHRTRARRRRSRSASPAGSVPPRPLAPCRGRARDGEAVGGHGRRQADG